MYIYIHTYVYIYTYTYTYSVYYNTLAYISYSWSDSNRLKKKKKLNHNATFPDLPDPPAVSSSPPFSYSRTPSCRFLGASENYTKHIGLLSGEDRSTKQKLHVQYYS